MQVLLLSFIIFSVCLWLTYGVPTLEGFPYGFPLVTSETAPHQIPHKNQPTAVHLSFSRTSCKVKATMEIPKAIGG